MLKTEAIAIKALKLALAEFTRISYQKKADPLVIESLNQALKYIENLPAKKRPFYYNLPPHTPDQELYNSIIATHSKLLDGLEMQASFFADENKHVVAQLRVYMAAPVDPFYELEIEEKLAKQKAYSKAFFLLCEQLGFSFTEGFLERL